MKLPQSEITRLLDQWSDGDVEALRRLMPQVVEDLRKVAHNQLASERPGHTLQPTALVNEVYLRLVGRRTVTWKNRAQFFAFVASMMRRILVDHSRTKKRLKRGSGTNHLSLDEIPQVPVAQADPELLDLHEALERLEQLDLRQARIVELRYFTGLTVEEIAEAEGISATTVKREWRIAKLWLLRELSNP
jgi:RNA polymerase sigma factor (TIGR02999 family)